MGHDARNEINILFYTAAVSKPNMEWFPSNDLSLRLLRELNAATARIMPAKCLGDEGSFSNTIAKIIVSAGPTDPMIVVLVAPRRTIASLIISMASSRFSPLSTRRFRTAVTFVF